MKKLLSLILIIAFMLSLGAFFGVSADTTPTYRVNLDGPLSAAAGQALTFSATVNGIATSTNGLKNVKFKIKYNPSAFEFVAGSIETAVLPASSWQVEKNTSVSGEILISAWASANSVTYAKGDGSVKFYFRLKVLSGATSPESITVSEFEGTAYSSTYGTVTGNSVGTSVGITTTKGEAPTKLELFGKTSTSLTVINLGTAFEYSLDLIHWQDSITFTGLTANTRYMVYARRKATLTTAASETSPALVVQTLTSSGSDPGGSTTPDPDDTTGIEIVSITETTIRIKVKSGCVYSINSGATWQPVTFSGLFTGLTPNTEYLIYERNETTMNLDIKKVTTGKYASVAPPAPTLSSKTSSTVTLISVAGCEFSKDKVNWQTSNVFTGLTPLTQYTFYARRAETQATSASAASAGFTVTTDVSQDTCTHPTTTESYNAPTCTAAGSRVKKCTVCGKDVSTEYYAALGHNASWRTASNATCTVSGSREYFCMTCGAVIRTETILPSGHSGAWRVAIAPTCTVKGTNEFYCTVCGEVIRTEAVDATGHQNTEVKTIKEATYEADGMRQVICTACGTVLSEETVPKLIDPNANKLSPGLIVLIIILVIVIIIASAVAVLWMLSKNTKAQKRSGRAGQITPQKPRVRGGMTDDQWLGRK